MGVATVTSFNGQSLASRKINTVKHTVATLEDRRSI
jgi:hypothetical protein